MKETRSWAARAKAKRREEGENWPVEDEKLWREEFPDDPQPGWMADKPEYAALGYVVEDDLIPVLDESAIVTDPADAAIHNLSIIDAYARWCGKMVPVVGSKTEGIKISCPNPRHPDKNPSAWINTDKNTYFCGGCQQGGDVWTIAAFFHDFPVPGYESKENFPKLKKLIATDLGYTESKSSSGHTIFVLPIEESDSEDDPEPEKQAPRTPVAASPPVESDSAKKSENDPEPPPDPPAVAPAPTLRVVEDDETVPQSFVPEGTERHKLLVDRGERIDWKNIVEPNSFLETWMYATAEQDDLAHEYYFWLGLQAIGCAVGANVVLNDSRRVKGNLYVCLYGGSGSGKTNSTKALWEVLEEALPFTEDPFTQCDGTKIIGQQGSAEALLSSFIYPLHDMSTNKAVGLAPVRGLLKIEELASFVETSARPGSNMKTRLIELYDAYQNDVSNFTMGRGNTIARAPFCSVVSTTQPKAIHQFLNRTDAESGFMNRWILATGIRRRARRAINGAPFDPTESVTYLRGVHSYSSSPIYLTLENEALEVWESFFQKSIVDMVDSDEDTMFARIDLTMKKLIVLFTANERRSEPTAEIVNKVIALFPYLKASYARFSADINHNEMSELEERIMRYVIKMKDKGMTKGQLLNNLRPAPLTLIDRAINTLSSLEQIKVQTFKAKSGKQTDRLVAAEHLLA